MLNLIVFEFYHRVDGRVLPSQLEESTGVSARTWRNNEISQKTLDTAARNSIDWIIQKLRKAGNSETDITKFVEQHPRFNTPGALYAGMIYENQVEGVMRFPKTLELAKRIDQLSSSLFFAKKSDDIESFKGLILDEAHNEQCFWHAEGVTESDIPTIISASSWEELDQHLGDISKRALISLLACWDIEFCTEYFYRYKPRSLFKSVLPKTDPAIGNVEIGDSIPKRRDMFWLPTRRLISLLICMRDYFEKGKWPKKIASVKDFSISINEPEQNLKKWRYGTKILTFKDFNYLWARISRCGSGHTNPPTGPTPIFIASKFWELIFVRKTDDGKVSEFVKTEDYDHFWARYSKNSINNVAKETLKEWPNCFDDI